MRTDNPKARTVEGEQFLPLPFVRRRPDGSLDFWAVQYSENEDLDFERGKRFGQMALEMTEYYLLTLVVQSMIAKGGLTKLEIGFLFEVGEMAWAQSRERRERKLRSRRPPGPARLHLVPEPQE